MTESIRRRVLQMALVWAFIGQWVGADIGMRAGGLAGSIAGSVAVMVEMAVLGAFLGWLGGRPVDTIIGAALGLLAGVMLVPLDGHADVLSRANMGLIAGASDGAALRPYLRAVGRVLGAAARQLGRPIAGISSPDHGTWIGASRSRGFRRPMLRRLGSRRRPESGPVAPDRSMVGVVASAGV